MPGGGARASVGQVSATLQRPLPRRLERRHERLLHPEVDGHLPQAPAAGGDRAQPGIEVIPEHWRARVLQVEPPPAANLDGCHQVQLLQARDLLDHARHVRDAGLAQRVRAVAAVVQDQPARGVERIQEVAAEADREPDHADERAARCRTEELLRLDRRRAEEAQVVRLGDEHELPATRARPGRGWLRRFRGQADAEHVRLLELRGETLAQPAHVGEVDVPLVDHELVERHERDVGRQRVEAAADERVAEELGQQRLVARAEARDRGQVRGAGLAPLEHGEARARGLPLLDEYCLVDRLRGVALDVVDERAQRRLAREVEPVDARRLGGDGIPRWGQYRFRAGRNQAHDQNSTLKVRARRRATRPSTVRFAHTIFACPVISGWSRRSWLSMSVVTITRRGVTAATAALDPEPSGTGRAATATAVTVPWNVT